MSSGLVAIFSWITRKNSTNGSMGNKKFAKKIFCHTPSGHPSKNSSKLHLINYLNIKICSKMLYIDKF